MDLIAELKNQKLNIRTCSVKSGIPYATLYPIIKGQVDIGTCAYYTVEKLAKVLGYRPDQIVYHKEDFQTFRNNLHHDIKRNDLQTVLDIIEHDDIDYYRFHKDNIKMFYMLATIDYICKRYEIPLCDKYNEIRNMKLEKQFFVGDSAFMGKDKNQGIEEFARYNIIEGDLYDAV